MKELTKQTLAHAPRNGAPSATRTLMAGAANDGLIRKAATNLTLSNHTARLRITHRAF